MEKARLQASSEEAPHSAGQHMDIPAQAFLSCQAGKGADDLQKTHSHGHTNQRALVQGDNTKPASGPLVLCPSILKIDVFELSSFNLSERYSRRLARNIFPRNESIESAKRINRTLNDLKGHSRSRD